MLLHLSAAMLMAFLTIAAGFQRAAQIEHRLRSLRDFQAALKLLETEVGYVARPLPQALAHIAASIGGRVGSFLQEVARQVDEGQSAEQAWIGQLNEMAETLALQREERALLQQFGVGLGIADRSRQLDRIAYTATHLSQIEQDARPQGEKNIRMWHALGLLGGALVFLVMV
ncbi:MAG: stage III sporulation protein AB [Firmicutes bacterium]|nr:stage III sporulation protein AB [Bacillota bacterium]